MFVSSKEKILRFKNHILFKHESRLRKYLSNPPFYKGGDRILCLGSYGKILFIYGNYEREKIMFVMVIAFIQGNKP